jgi:hypothetical protein
MIEFAVAQKVMGLVITSAPGVSFPSDAWTDESAIAIARASPGEVPAGDALSVGLEAQPERTSEAAAIPMGMMRGFIELKMPRGLGRLPEAPVAPPSDLQKYFLPKNEFAFTYRHDL